MQITLPAPVRAWMNENRGELSVPRFILKVLEQQMLNNTPPYLGKGINDGEYSVCNVREGVSEVEGGDTPSQTE